MADPGIGDREVALRREVRVHWALTFGFTITLAGAALAFADRLLSGPAPVWYLILNGVSGIGFLILIQRQARSAIRASRELEELRRLPNEQL